jgi:hypothetical protein
MEKIMPDEYLEANYHFTLSAMLDLIEKYGYKKVLEDLDVMVVDRIEEALLCETV